MAAAQAAFGSLSSGEDERRLGLGNKSPHIVPSLGNCSRDKGSPDMHHVSVWGMDIPILSLVRERAIPQICAAVSVWGMDIPKSSPSLGARDPRICAMSCHGGL